MGSSCNFMLEIKVRLTEINISHSSDNFFTSIFFLLEGSRSLLSNEPRTGANGSLVSAPHIIILVDPPLRTIFQYPCSHQMNISWAVDTASIFDFSLRAVSIEKNFGVPHPLVGRFPGNSAERLFRGTLSKIRKGPPLIDVKYIFFDLRHFNFIEIE